MALWLSKFWAKPRWCKNVVVPKHAKATSENRQCMSPKIKTFCCKSNVRATIDMVSTRTCKRLTPLTTTKENKWFTHTLDVSFRAGKQFHTKKLSQSLKACVQKGAWCKDFFFFFYQWAGKWRRGFVTSSGRCRVEVRLRSSPSVFVDEPLLFTAIHHDHIDNWSILTQVISQE